MKTSFFKSFTCDYGTAEAVRRNEYWLIATRGCCAAVVEACTKGLNVVAAGGVNPDGGDDDWLAITAVGDLPEGWKDQKPTLVDGYVLHCVWGKK